ncbi:MAG: cation-translocating P-type ATPase, partial [Phycisphaerales bacterium]|nr:cation-translocating P-type ATPase [Phycisphaerales bacterium]
MSQEQPPAEDGHRLAGPLAVFSAKGELVGAVVAGVLLAAGWVGAAVGEPELRGLVWGSLAIGMVYGGRAAITSLRARAFDIDVLMVVGAGLAAYLNAPAEGALLLFLFTLAGALEDLAMARTRHAVEALHSLMPTAASRQTQSGEWEAVAPELLGAGDVVRVLPGESIPADAGITDGRSAVDQATLTGESFPRVVGVGDEVYAGTINVGSAFLARVVRPAAQSSLQRVLNLVLEAQQQREPVQRILDRLSQPYALTVMALSVLTLTVWWLGFGEPLLGDGEGGKVGALYTAITLLIVMSPCAVIIATPTATLAAISRGARAGVLFKGGQAIERLAGLRAVALDKTGTLTVGRPVVSEVAPIGWSNEGDLLAVAAGLEQESTHPIAAAIREEAQRRGIEPEPTASRTSFAPGAGVSGVFRGSEARLGTYEHAEPLIPVCYRAQVRQEMLEAQSRGDIAVVLAWNQMAGVVVMSDRVRPGAPGLVDGLHAMGIKPIVMLTGDNRATARTVAERLGIDRWEAQMLPEDKVSAVKALHAELRG